MLAADAEALATATAAQPERYPLAIKAVWEIAAAAYERAGDNAASRRCQLNAIDQTLEMRNEVGSASAAAHWTRTAISQLRSVEGTRDQREALRLELRALQETAQDEFGSFSVPLDLNEIAIGTIELFDKLTLPSMLLQFALLWRPERIQKLREEALATALHLNHVRTSPH